MRHANIRVNSIRFKDDTVMNTAALNPSSIQYEGQVLNLLELINDIKIGNLTLDITPLPLYERGQVLKNLNLTWTYNTEVKRQVIEIEGEQEEIGAEERSISLTKRVFSTDTDIKIIGESTLQRVEKEVRVRFGSRIYYGTREEEDYKVPISVVQIMNSKVYERAEEFNMQMKGVKGYIYLLIPTRFIPIGGGINVYSNNMINTSWVISNSQIKNPFNNIENYRVYRSIYKYRGGNLQLGIVRS